MRQSHPPDVALFVIFFLVFFVPLGFADMVGGGMTLWANVRDIVSGSPGWRAAIGRVLVSLPCSALPAAGLGWAAQAVAVRYGLRLTGRPNTPQAADYDDTRTGAHATGPAVPPSATPPSGSASPALRASGSEAVMNHPTFGEIVYHQTDGQWTGRCRLPTFAEYGREENGSLEEPDADFRQGLFDLTLLDETGNGPSPEQENVFRYLLEHEPQVCQAVMSELLKFYREFYGNWDWVRRRQSRAARWVTKWLLPPDYKTPDDLRLVARCTGVEISSDTALVYAFVAFHFETADNMEVEHGLSVVFHPHKGTQWGTGSVLYEAIDGW